MISLVYVSFASHKMTDDELKDILKVARETNEKLGVSGMLLYRDGFFIQAIEGEEEAVKALYERISKDPRHMNVTTVNIHPITERAFVGWHMGFNKLSDIAPTGIDDDGYTDFLTNPNSAFFTDNPDHAKILLNSFRDQIYF
ncbi:MAG: BLUF domain-containing protein [bacterium]|nr:BLUF domain-containing protein [bacterium]